MHYLRILRPPTLTLSRGSWTIPVVLNITTDLSDALLTLPNTIKLKVGVYEASADHGGRRVPPEEVMAAQIVDWTPGSRVLKTELRLPPGPKPTTPLRVFAFPSAQLWGGSTADVLVSMKPQAQGRIMPVWADVHVGDDAPAYMCCRRLRVGAETSPSCLEIEEDLGESMARHIWDGGVAAACLLLEQASPSDASAPKSTIISYLAFTFPANIVEIGCGVGTLGLAAALWRKGESQVLMTDLPDARARAEANISRWSTQHLGDDTKVPKFEDLDWQDGMKGEFGPELNSRSWDLVILSDCTYNIDVLPALVGTLSALHDHSSKIRGTSDTPWESRVLLATKQRHSSEEAVFRMMADEGWVVAEEETFPLLNLGAEEQSLQLYLYKK
ncbi:putative methyltransferase-domain-containing protein [Plectosphaerella plurivora]|uniref:Methyltransferase-domain-containing protein n=1 Tax=Plectosphaerella plurivora TaxID=936078 RepID=A0A9P9ADU9_9PEZI|nr:putative methyltransferase-domain-containing protein [Plectosphaerella plurivora]